MPNRLQRFQESGELHFVTFSCHDRKPYLVLLEARDTFERSLEQIRRRCHFFHRDWIEEGHGGAEFLADFSIGCLASASRKASNFFAAGVLVGEKLLREGAVLNFGEDLLHGLAALVVDDARAADVVAPLGGVGDGVAHVGEAAAIDEIDDELELVQALEVGALGLIAGLDQGLKAALTRALTPPQSTACSPKRSVSVSSLKVVSSTPARVQPMPLR
jgi:hypothetical protein